MKDMVTYCERCGDGWGDEDFMFGTCCNRPLKERLETDEEERSRESAVKAILDRASKLNW